MTDGTIRALLLDLDNTLLINDMETFAPRYYEALLHKVEPYCFRGRFLEALGSGIRAMSGNDGSDGTNEQVFYGRFFSLVGVPRETLMPVLADFYEHEFHDLSVLTRRDPLAFPLVELAFQRGYQVAIATQPLFPLAAIRARLSWAGVGAELFDYAFVSSFEVMGASKPRPRFFRTILEALGRAPEECLMVGDSVTADMPAADLGIKTFWVDRGQEARPSRVPCDARGDLADLIDLVKTGRIHAL